MMSIENKKPVFAWDSMPNETIELIYNEGSVMLMELTDLAQAGDQKATALCGMLGGGALALLTTIATLLASDHYTKPYLIFALGTTAFFLMLGSLAAMAAVRPIDFYLAGSDPKNSGSVLNDRIQLLKFLSEQVSDRIDVNREVLKKSARLMNIAFLLAILSILTGIAVFTVLYEAGFQSF